MILLPEFTSWLIKIFSKLPEFISWLVETFSKLTKFISRLVETFPKLTKFTSWLVFSSAARIFFAKTVSANTSAVIPSPLRALFLPQTCLN